MTITRHDYENEHAYEYDYEYDAPMSRLRTWMCLGNR
jgi:hypothetical protein